jgi:hypothetical protein
MYADMANGEERMATFYGSFASDSCEKHRRYYASYCEWDKTVYPKCRGSNPDNLLHSRCRPD